MNISEKLQYYVDLNNDTQHLVIRQPLVRGDVRAHNINVLFTQNGSPATLTGVSLGCSVVMANNTTVTTTGTIENSTGHIFIDSSAYTVSGEVNLFVRLTSIEGDNTFTRTVLWLTGNVVAADSDLVVVPEGTVLPSIDQFNTIYQQATAAKNTCVAAAADVDAAIETIEAYPYTQVQTWTNEAKAAAAEAKSMSKLPDIPTTGGTLMLSADTDTREVNWASVENCVELWSGSQPITDTSGFSLSQDRSNFKYLVICGTYFDLVLNSNRSTNVSFVYSTSASVGFAKVSMTNSTNLKLYFINLSRWKISSNAITTDTTTLNVKKIYGVR